MTVMKILPISHIGDEELVTATEPSSFQATTIVPTEFELSSSEFLGLILQNY